MKILYIHGFGSSSFGAKSKVVKNYFGSSNVFSPSLSYVPNLAIDTLEQVIDFCPNIGGIIGSSLGGYYAIYLSHKFNIKSVLINPAIRPYDILRRAIPKGINYYDNSFFEFKTQYLDFLKEIEIANPDISKFLVLLQKGDEVLDYREALENFQNGNIILEEGGNHSFENFESKLPAIRSFFNG